VTAVVDPQRRLLFDEYKAAAGPCGFVTISSANFFGLTGAVLAREHHCIGNYSTVPVGIWTPWTLSEVMR